MTSAHQNHLKLLAVYPGGRAPRCNTEPHDVVFVVGESVESCYERLMDKRFGDPLRPHIDAWVELQGVDGYRVSLERLRRAQNQTAIMRRELFLRAGARLRRRRPVRGFQLLKSADQNFG